MTALRKIEIELPEAMARKVEEKVASGAFPDSSAVVADALDEAFGHDEFVERWLRDAVVPTYDAWKRDGVAGLSVSETREMLRLRRLTGAP